MRPAPASAILASSQSDPDQRTLQVARSAFFDAQMHSVGRVVTEMANNRRSMIVWEGRDCAIETLKTCESLQSLKVRSMFFVVHLNF